MARVSGQPVINSGQYGAALDVVIVCQSFNATLSFFLFLGVCVVLRDSAINWHLSNDKSKNEVFF